MTFRQRLGAVVCWWRGCAVAWEAYDDKRNRWYCPRCGWEVVAWDAHTAWAEMTQDWGR